MALFVYPPTTISTSGLATEAKQDDIISELQDIESDVESGNSSLSTIASNTSDVATETTLSSIETNTADVATETTLSSLNSKVTAVDTTGKATEAKQDDAITQLTIIAGDTTSLDSKVTTCDTGAVVVSSSALPSGASTSANQTTANASLSNIESDINDLNARLAGNLVPETFDYIAITYVAAGNGTGEIETVTYNTGGSGGTTVATLTLAYDANDRLASVTRS